MTEPRLPRAQTALFAECGYAECDALPHWPRLHRAARREPEAQCWAWWPIGWVRIGRKSAIVSTDLIFAKPPCC